MIAGTRSGVGKTTVTIGILGALRRHGVRAQPFKVGPDYIDGSYHTAVSGLPCRNLDAWLLPPGELIRLTGRALASADVGIIEGAMGLFDGRGRGSGCSSAHVARLLKCPIVLIADASASSSSIGAEMLGFRRFDRRIWIAGAIVNNVAGARHAEACAGALRRVGVRALGWLPRDESVRLPERHLGLVPMPERTASGTPGTKGGDAIHSIVRLVEGHVNLDALLQVANRAPSLLVPGGRFLRETAPSRVHARGSPRPTIGIAYDGAFNFYYRDALEALEAAGAHVRYFSPLAGEFPEMDALYLGGGFPEVHVDALQASPATPRIRRFCESGRPVLAECGGLMYLTRGITDFEGRRGRMVGFLDAETRMIPRLTLAYTRANARSGCLIASSGAIVRGHEFHSSVLEGVSGDARFAFDMEIGTGVDGKRDGWREAGVMASYMHCHLAAGRRAARFVEAIRTP